MFYKLRDVHDNKIGLAPIHPTTSVTFSGNKTIGRPKGGSNEWHAYSPVARIVKSRDRPLLMGKLPGFVYDEPEYFEPPTPPSEPVNRSRPVRLKPQLMPRREVVSEPAPPQRRVETPLEVLEEEKSVRLPADDSALIEIRRHV